MEFTPFYQGDKETLISIESYDTLKDAIKAIETSIPLFPHYQFEIMTYEGGGFPPITKHFIKGTLKHSSDLIEGSHYKFCPYCGEKLK